MTETPNINESLIREYVASQRADLLISWFSSMRANLQRAEAERDCFMASLAKMAATRGVVAQDIAAKVRASLTAPDLPERRPGPPAKRPASSPSPRALSTQDFLTIEDEEDD